MAGADAIANAAGVARAVYPARTDESSPKAVVIVDQGDWRAAISAAQLMARPLRAPILFSDGGNLPAASTEALQELAPSGAPQADDAQVIRIGDDAAKPDNKRIEAVPGASSASLAQAIDKLQAKAAGDPTQAVLVAPADNPEFAMPAAGWAARSGDPVLWTLKDSLPAETRAAIQSHPRARIYVLGPPDAISDGVFRQLSKLGRTKRIAGADPVANAIAFARYTDGRFGWGVVDPGHGLVFANVSRTLDAAAGAALSGSGQYGPLLLLTEAGVAARAAAGLPARHPAGLRQGPGARRLQSRLADGRRDRDLGGCAVAPGCPAGDPTRRHLRQLTPMAQAEQPERLRRDVTVDDVRQLMGSSTPHFSLQIRQRISQADRRAARRRSRPPARRARDRAAGAARVLR